VPRIPVFINLQTNYEWLLECLLSARLKHLILTIFPFPLERAQRGLTL
jgi:hypothetical protein